MFAFPQIVGLPLLTSLDGGMVHGPTLGAVFTWMLLAALIGTGLGILREASQSRGEGRQDVAPILSDPVDLDIDYSHRDAA